MKWGSMTLLYAKSVQLRSELGNGHLILRIVMRFTYRFILIDDKVSEAGMPSSDYSFQSHESLCQNEMITAAPKSGFWCGNHDPAAAV